MNNSGWCSYNNKINIVQLLRNSFAFKYTYSLIVIDTVLQALSSAP